MYNSNWYLGALWNICAVLEAGRLCYQFMFMLADSISKLDISYRCPQMRNLHSRNLWTVTESLSQRSHATTQPNWPQACIGNRKETRK